MLKQEFKVPKNVETKAQGSKKAETEVHEKVGAKLPGSKKKVGSNIDKTSKNISKTFKNYIKKHQQTSTKPRPNIKKPRPNIGLSPATSHQSFSC